MNILMIEDDTSIRIGLKYYLEEEGFNVFEVGIGLDAMNILENNDINLVLLDVNLPDISGFDLFNKIKSIKNVPVIYLTASDLEVSVVMGLDMGADDYITKPFKAKELCARIKAVLRRNSTKTTDNLIRVQNIIIDLKAAKVLKNNKDLFLTALEYKILLILAMSPNTTFSREQILANIWDVNEDYVSDNTLTVYIKRIREKIENDPSNPKIILTVRKLGYKLGEKNEN